jgi:hypothetical protein
MKLRASLVVATALIALGATASASIMPEASESASVPRSLYSPMPVAEQPVTLRTFKATSADYFVAPISPVRHFESGKVMDTESFGPAETPSASLIPGGGKATL